MTLTEFTKFQHDWTKSQWTVWEERVQELEEEGLTRSDAQGVADVEFAGRST